MKNKLNTIKEIVVWLIVIFAIGMMIFTIFSVSTFDQNDRSVFGYKFFISRSDSMSATDFDAGDVIFVKNVDPATLKEGDIIAYTSQNDASYGETITHKIREVTTDENGNPGFITYGTTTDTNDETIVTYEYVIGKYVGKIPNIGRFFAFLKTIPGYLICILLPFLLLIGYYGWKSVKLFKKYRKEQEEELQAEKDKVAEEKRQSEEMMKELQSLRSQLAAKEGAQQEQQVQQQFEVQQQPMQTVEVPQQVQAQPRPAQPTPQNVPQQPVQQEAAPRTTQPAQPQARPVAQQQPQVQQPQTRPIQQARPAQPAPQSVPQQPVQQEASPRPAQPTQQSQPAPTRSVPQQVAQDRPATQQQAPKSEPAPAHRINIEEIFKSK